ncbi:putative bifunctional diguanylate cyclase/phosphodiesterase [Anaeromicropila herbilytica]|uniref:Diguanylate cyclase (GGDEF) domain-containing protein n=1 Tax=Anaeromicropila herbilytica TaxID=2785025 RepID=A0A7R7IE54_9FIRM|nr:bifunctional diguanylate cyclase/phosphodiesterase [Anaeromicropila herbilytica]BCN32272.1 hypothetical protein bsdtb5_35670 [Anaeromicropila herbilytica]
MNDSKNRNQKRRKNRLYKRYRKYKKNQRNFMSTKGLNFETCKVTLIYLLTGALWITVSDKVLLIFTKDIQVLKQMQLYKGWFYVIVTAAIFCYIIRRSFQSLTYYDRLTGLPNRAYLEQEALKAARHNQKYAVIILDIDNFKHLNDIMGYETSDNFIKEFAMDISAYQFESKGGIVAKIIGNEFAILIKGVEETRTLCEQLDYLLKKIRGQWEIEENQFFITVSMGASLYGEHGTEFKTLMQRAEIAMFEQKAKGKDGFTIFENCMHLNSIKFIQLSNRLREALPNKELLLYFQPQYDIRTGELFGLEALIRWNHPTKGFIPPIEFISIAEKTGYIVELSEWTLKTAIEQKREWDKKGLPSVKIAINMSGCVITNTKVFENICNILDELKIQPGEIEVEVTETAVMMELDKAKIHLQKLKEYGISIAIDDFGSGYSSLNYLNLLPFDILKIDYEFLNKIKNKEDESLIYQTIIRLAHDMNLSVIAEGVETIEQLEFLKKYQCDIGQGYYYCKPIPAIEIEKLLLSEISMVHETLD